MTEKISTPMSELGLNFKELSKDVLGNTDTPSWELTGTSSELDFTFNVMRQIERINMTAPYPFSFIRHVKVLEIMMSPDKDQEYNEAITEITKEEEQDIKNSYDSTGSLKKEDLEIIQEKASWKKYEALMGLLDRNGNRFKTTGRLNM